MAYRANLFDFGAIAGAAGGANAAANDAAFAAALASPVQLIEVDPEIFEISQTIVHAANGKEFRGIDGSDVFGMPSTGTRLKWTGAIGGTMVDIRPTTPGTDVIAPGFCGFQLHGGGKARRGLMTRATRRPRVEGVQVVGLEPTGASICFYLSSLTSAAQVNCTYRGEFKRLSAGADGGAHGFMLDGSNDPAFPGNTTFCTITDLHVVHGSGIGIYLRSCDDNHFINAGTSRVEGGTGVSVLIDGMNSYNVGNVFWGLHCGAHPAGAQTTIMSRGSKARQNRIYGLSGVDNQPQVLITDGSELYYEYSGGGYTPTLAAEKALDRVPKQQIRSY